jgi:S-adenosylmethionine synthetase
MFQDKHLFTSESVTEGHPDKIADQISDGVLDAVFEKDPYGRVACETMVTTGLVVIAGEITTREYVDIPKVARGVIKRIGYTDADYGFDYETCGIVTSIDEQSADISQGVTQGEGLHDAQGAGDQGLMFGFACDETDEYMPLPITLSHSLTKRLAEVRKDGTVPFLRPDGKSQVTVEYDDGHPVRIDTVVISTQHDSKVTYEELHDELVERVINPVLPQDLVDPSTIKYHINPTGRFVVGGPMGDAGLTGRKIIVDTYGGHGSHGGGAFSGKDPSKVDRSASYAARWVAKNIVAAGLAKRCEVQLSYAIGIAEPVSIMVDTVGTGILPDVELTKAVRNVFDLRPEAIIKTLNLRRPIYQKTASYGHFGRSEPEFNWEKTDRVEELQEVVGVKGQQEKLVNN